MITLGIALLSSIFTTITINRLFRLYTINMKNAFKVDYGMHFTPIDKFEKLDISYEVEEEVLRTPKHNSAKKFQN